MGVATHAYACEYLLLQKYPDGLLRHEFVEELLRRGWHDRNDRRCYGDDNEKGWSNLKDYLPYDRRLEHAVVENGKIFGVGSWIPSNVSLFCVGAEANTEAFLEAQREGDERFLKQVKEPNYGNVFYDLDGDGKFKFYPGSAGTPMAWRHTIDFVYMAVHLTDPYVWNEQYMSDTGEKRLDEYKDVLRNIAGWYCNKFQKDFYEICREYYDYLVSSGAEHVLCPDTEREKLMKIRPCHFVRP